MFDAAAIHHHHQIGQRHRFFLAMGDMDEGDSEFALQALQLFPHLDAQEGVESGERLIQKQHPRLHDQRPRQGHALLLPAG